MLYLLPLLLVALGLLAMGCKRSPSMVGTWESKLMLGKVEGTSRIEFKEDGTFNGLMTFPTTVPLTIVDTGTWKLEKGTRLTTHIDTTDWSFGGDSPAIEVAKKRLEASKAKILAESNSHPLDVITWNGSDLYWFKNQKGEIREYRRVK